MNYQLVLQFSAKTLEDFDELIKLQDNLMNLLEGSEELDGHDFGCGEFNYFIYTGNPAGTFARIKRVFDAVSIDKEMRVGYRVINEDDFVPVWPPDLTRFEIA